MASFYHRAVRCFAFAVLFAPGCSCAEAEHQRKDAGGPSDAGDAGDAAQPVDASDQRCREGERRCDPDREVVQQCQPGGVGWDDVETCEDPYPICQGAECRDPCRPTDPPSYQGCDYFAVDLEQIDQQAGPYTPKEAPFAVVVSNTDDRRAAHVQVYTGDADSENPRGDEVTVAPNDLAVLDLGQRNVEGTDRDFLAFRIRSDIPISAYQFNPIDTPEAFSNDASLLLPTTTAGTRYYAVTGDGITALDDINVPGVFSEWPPTVTIVGIQDGITNVHVRLGGPIVTGAGMSGGAGDEFDIALGRYEVANITGAMTGGDPGPAGDGNLTGTYVEAEAPVAVFSGNPAAVVPHGPPGVCCADHLEEQLWPVEIWGTRFLVPRSPPRASEDDWIVLVAAEDGTSLEYFPATPPGAPTALGAGEWASVAVDADFAVQATAPILVTQLLASASEASFDCDMLDPDRTNTCRDLTGYDSSRCNPVAFGSDEGRCSQVGDPSLVQIPPIVQYGWDYVFVVPEGYARDTIVVAGPDDADLTLDGAPIDDASTRIADFDGTTWVRWRIEIEDGTHRLRSTSTSPVNGSRSGATIARRSLCRIIHAVS